MSERELPKDIRRQVRAEVKSAREQKDLLSLVSQEQLGRTRSGQSYHPSRHSKKERVAANTLSSLHLYKSEEQKAAEILLELRRKDQGQGESDIHNAAKVLEKLSEKQ
jgi:hypothetical protein